MAFTPFIIETDEPESRVPTQVDGALQDGQGAHDTQGALTGRQVAAIRHAVGLFRRALGILEATFPDAHGGATPLRTGEHFAPTGDPDKDALERRYARLYARLSYANGHMLWPGATDRGTAGGKPIVQWHGKITRVSRIVWEREVGPIGEHGRLMPRCDVATCVSPKHHALVQASPVAPPDGLAPLPTSAPPPGGPGLCRRGHLRAVQPNGRVVCRKCDRARKAGRSPFEPDHLELLARARPPVDRVAPATPDEDSLDEFFVDDGELDAPILP